MISLEPAIAASFSSRAIGHRDLADVRLDGAERIVRRLRRRRLRSAR